MSEQSNTTQQSSIIECLRQYFSQAPGLAGKRIDIDCLRSKPDSYSIDCVPTERVVQRYVDGSTVRRQLFTISSRAAYGPNIAQQRGNVETFEELEAWLMLQDAVGTYPNLGEKRHTRALEILSSAYPIEADDGDQGSIARYQIQLGITYYQEV